MSSEEELIRIVLDSFEAEKQGDVQAGLELLHEDFERVSIIERNGNVFPRIKKDDIPEAMKEAYEIKGRAFHVLNVAANEESQTVFVELIEVVPRGNKKVIWPYTLVCEIEESKIKRTRHYGDPSLLKEKITVQQIKDLIKE